MIEVSGVDDQSGTVFFNANKGDPRRQQLFSVKVDGSGMAALSSEKGSTTGDFADDAKHYVEHHSDTLQPPRLSVCAAGGSCQKIWEARSVSEYGLVAPKDLEFKADDGTVLYGFSAASECESKPETPLIVYIYGGPA